MTTTALAFSAAERAFLAEQRIGHLATTTSDGSPTVVPLGYRVGDGATILLTGFALAQSAKWRNLQRDERFAFVVDAGIGPTARGILLRGRAELDDRELIVLRPETIISWGVESHPYQRLTRRLSGAPGA